MKYFFRGLPILDYDPETKQLEAPMDKDVTNTAYFNQCNFIAEDYALLEQYFATIAAHARGEDVELKDIEVY